MRPRTLLSRLPALALAAALAVSGGEPQQQQQPEAETTGTTAERAASARSELRPAQAAPDAKRPVRVILPSPYAARP